MTTSEQTIDNSLVRLCRALDWVRRMHPKLTLTGLLALMIIARETASRDLKLIPTASKLGDYLRISSSSAGRLLDTLSEGRVRDGVMGEGLGLVMTDHWIWGRRTEGYVLTQRGRDLVNQILKDLTGSNPDWFDPFDENALVQILVRDAAKT